MDKGFMASTIGTFRSRVKPACAARHRLAAEKIVFSPRGCLPMRGVCGMLVPVARPPTADGYPFIRKKI